MRSLIIAEMPANHKNCLDIAINTIKAAKKLLLMLLISTNRYIFIRDFKIIKI